MSGPTRVGAGANTVEIRLPRFFKSGVGTLILLVVVLALARYCLSYVHPNQYGIKEVKVGVMQSRGIKEENYGAGYAMVIPAFERMHRLPKGVLVLEMSNYPSTDGENHHILKAAKIQTSDGFYVDVDVSILYRISDPYQVVRQLGPGEMFLHQGILPKAEPVLKEALGSLTTEDFYNSPMRTAQAENARDAMHALLEPLGLSVDQVLIRYFEYSEEIQRNIEEKKLQDQLVFKNKAQAKSAMEEANLKRVKEEGLATVKIETERGSAYRIEKDAEKELYLRTKTAEGDKEVELAEADRTEWINAAMQTAGVDRLVAQEMAEVYKGIELVVLPTGEEGGMNPLDLNALLKVSGVEIVDGGSREVSRVANPVMRPPAATPPTPEPVAVAPSPPPPPAVPAPPEAADNPNVPADGEQE
jgi:regulator of protease activity HflC (stomatin/prohibitin superfamily)